MGAIAWSFLYNLDSILCLQAVIVGQIHVTRGICLISYYFLIECGKAIASFGFFDIDL